MNREIASEARTSLTQVSVEKWCENNLPECVDCGWKTVELTLEHSWISRDETSIRKRTDSLADHSPLSKFSHPFW